MQREVEAPDLWGAVAAERALLDAAISSGDSSRPFTPEEQQYVSEKLSEIQENLLTTHGLVAEEAELVRSRLKYLTEAAQRQSRQDWLHTAIGVLFTLVLALTFSAAEAADLFRIAGVVLKLILKGSTMLPQ